MRTKLSEQQLTTILEFINNQRHKYPKKSDCLKAAFDKAGATVKVNSNSVYRYFTKAEAHTNTASAPKRQTAYTRKQQQRNIQINFCPNCGLNLHNVATGIALGGMK